MKLAGQSSTAFPDQIIKVTAQLTIDAENGNSRPDLGTWGHALKQPGKKIFTVSRADHDFAVSGEFKHHAFAAGDAVDQLSQQSATALGS